jgi:hypothetical protein
LDWCFWIGSYSDLWRLFLEKDKKYFNVILMIACVTCQANSAMNGSDAIGWSIFFLLIVILLVVSTAVFFIIRMARRARQFSLIEEAEMLAELKL